MSSFAFLFIGDTSGSSGQSHPRSSAARDRRASSVAYMHCYVRRLNRVSREIGFYIRSSIAHELPHLQESWPAPLVPGTAQIGNGKTIKLLYLTFVQYFGYVHFCSTSLAL
jgi:hypothetical protein